MGKSVRQQRKASNSQRNVTKDLAGQRWLEMCFDPTCECYGVTTHWESGHVSHRPFTGKELIDNARWGL